VKDRTIKFAVLGVGHIGKRHAEMILQNKHAQLIAVADTRTPETCKVQHINVPFFYSINELLQANLSIDVINICTPNGLHAQQTIQALNNGLHVVCEKPLALSTKDTEQIYKTAKQVNKHVFCVKQNRYSPPSVWIKNVIDSKIMGDIYMVNINCLWNRDERYYKQDSWRGTKKLDGGTLFTQFSHFIDIMYWLFGDITNIKSKFANFAHKKIIEFEDSGIITFDFINGAIGSLNYSTAVVQQNIESSITIIAEKGSVKIGGQYMNEVMYCKINGYEMPQIETTNPGNNYGEYTGSAANHHILIQNVIDTLNGKDSPTATIQEGIKVVDIIQRMYQNTL